MKGTVEVKMVVKGQIELEYYWKVGRKLRNSKSSK